MNYVMSLKDTLESSSKPSGKGHTSTSKSVVRKVCLSEY